MKKKIFLSGPIRGLTREESLTWRNNATNLLSEKFEVIHALRGREEKETFTDPRAAVIRDLDDVKKSDLILVNDTLDNCSMIGTSMEVFYAFEQKKPVIIFGDAHSKDYFLNYHSHLRVKTLEEACEIVLKMFS
jgi:nucleoside 2-deoxyribosyltransferase